jgi:hypothetical protein
VTPAKRTTPSLGTIATQAASNVAITGGSVTGVRLVEAVVILTDGANIATDASLGNIFTVTLGGNRTLDNPTNAASGQVIIYRIKQDGSGSRTITWGSDFRFSGGTAPTLTTTANRTDYIHFAYDAADARWDCVSNRLNF